MHQLSTPEQLFSQLLAAEPSRPFVTYYDEATGERAELSAKSTANWVAKTSHLLGDELGLGVGSLAFVTLPAHWISVPIILGCLTAGLELTDDATETADVAFVVPEELLRAVTVPDVFAIAPSNAAVGFAGAPPVGAADYVTAVRPHADVWGGVRLVAGPHDPCLDGRTRGEVVDWAASRAAALGFDRGARVLSSRDWRSSADWVDAILAPLVVGGSLVLVRNGDAAVLDRRAEQERTTARLN